MQRRAVALETLLLLLLTACSLPKGSPGTRVEGREKRDVILTPTRLGSLKLDAPVTLRQIQAAFPGRTVDTGCGETQDSRYCYFAVSRAPLEGTNENAEELFTLISALEGGQASRSLKKPVGPTEPFVPSGLTVSSPSVRDSFGVRVGDRYSRLRQLRKETLEFGASGESLFLGAGRIFYQFDVPPARDGGFDRQATEAAEQDLARIDARVSALNWPRPLP
jgi:hypothetical protein